MDHLWSPWRYRYVSNAGTSGTCVFCAKANENRDEDNLILYRDTHCFVVLNLFPYTTGHLMVVPYEHVATLEDASADSLQQMFLLAAEASRHLRAEYNPPGLNLGMNIGECAGAGIAGHIHMHVLPRWPGDVNFMTAIGETRVLPEDLADTYKRLSRCFQREEPSGR
ncbi:MAG: HIT domain-containing protein [Acidobacteria bacterium]|nr:HIT domain-containing protein [Acidobacteriota bacterium]